MIYLYGGSFDPITIAHLAIIQKVFTEFVGQDDTLQVLVSNNDSKKCTTPADHRYKMVTEFLQDGPRLVVRMQEQRTLQYIKENISPFEPVTVVVGEDQMESILRKEWRDADELCKRCKFLVVTRNEFGQPPKHYPDDVTQISIPYTQGISSSLVRNAFYADPMMTYQGFLVNCIDVRTYRYIKRHSLYNQNSEIYPEELSTFLNQYEGKKFKNAIRRIMVTLKENKHCDDVAVTQVLDAAERAYGEPSVTTDIVAYTENNQILLVRRKKDPYKNYWALPGGFFEKTDQDLCYGAARELKEETSLDLCAPQFEQIKAYGHNFDPRMKIVDVAFSVPIPNWAISLIEGADDAAEARLFPLNGLPPLAFHHAQIIEDWKKTLTH